MRSKYTKKKPYGGGHLKRISTMVLIMAIIYMYLIYKEPQIQLIDVGPDELIQPEDIGISLVPYNKNVKNAINNFLNTETGYNRVKVQLDYSVLQLYWLRLKIRFQVQYSIFLLVFFGTMPMQHLTKVYLAVYF